MCVRGLLLLWRLELLLATIFGHQLLGGRRGTGELLQGFLLHEKHAEM